MNAEDLKSIVKQANQIPDAHIANIGAHVVNRISTVLGGLYNGTGIELSVGWLADANVRARAYERVPGVHKIEISYGLATWLYRQAHILTAIIKTDHLLEKYSKAFIGSPSGQTRLLPEGTTAEQCRDLMFDTTLEWVFLHELTHHAQSHLNIRSAHSSASNLEIVDEAHVIGEPPLTGEEAKISHATEIAADHEAVIHLLPYRAFGNKGKQLPQAEVFMFVCGLVSLFHKFYGSSSAPPEPIPVGTHPHPAVRFALARSAIMGVLSNPDFVSASAHWAIEKDKTFSMIDEAYTVGALYSLELDNRASSEKAMAFIMSTNIKERPNTKAYLRTIFSQLKELTPEIERQYVFTLLKAKLPVITQEWEDLVKDASPADASSLSV